MALTSARARPGRHRTGVAFALGLALGAAAIAACSAPAQPGTEASGATERMGPTPSTLQAPAPTRVPPPALADGVKFIAHRGVYQTYHREGLEDDTCTATRIDPPRHSLLENTLPSIAAAFEAGASVVEIDIAPTSDGVLAVFHDWTLDCRTDGTGAIRDHTWEELSQLDIGHGYTADGETYPFRGEGIGLMPRLEEVFEAFPEGRFLINFKSNDVAEAALLQQVVESSDAAEQVWGVYGRRTEVVDAYVDATGARGFSRVSLAACLGELVADGDAASRLPSCEDTVVAVPIDLGPVLPGWPEVLVARMADHGTEVIISGPDPTRLSGIDDPTDLARVPDGLDVFVWTDRIEALS